VKLNPRLTFVKRGRRGRLSGLSVFDLTYIFSLAKEYWDREDDAAFGAGIGRARDAYEIAWRDGVGKVIHAVLSGVFELIAGRPASTGVSVVMTNNGMTVEASHESLRSALTQASLRWYEMDEPLRDKHFKEGEVALIPREHLRARIILQLIDGSQDRPSPGSYIPDELVPLSELEPWRQKRRLVALRASLAFSAKFNADYPGPRTNRIMLMDWFLANPKPNHLRYNRRG
jgi:hypothetical protein